MKRLALYSLIAVCTALMAVHHTDAQQRSDLDVPRTISFQGLLTSNDGDPLPDGNYTVTVHLYGDANGTELLWQDAYTTGIRNGIFNIYLGSGNEILPGSNVLNRPLWIGTTVNGGEEMRPLTPLTASPYALNLPDNAVTTGKLADGAVTAEKVEMDYLAGISIDGQMVTGQASVLNLVSSPDISLEFDQSNNNVRIMTSNSGSMQSDPEKRRRVLDTMIATDNWIGRDANEFPTATNVPTIGGGTYNTIAGGSNTAIDTLADYSSIVGGDNNTIEEDSDHGFIGGGENNTIRNSTNHNFIGGGDNNDIKGSSDSNAITGGAANTIDSGDANFIGGGNKNEVEAGSYNVIVGGGGTTMVNGRPDGDKNHIRYTDYGTIGGGRGNLIDSISHDATIAGGIGNTIGPRDINPYSDYYIANELGATIGGGGGNIANGGYSTVAGGHHNNAYGDFSFVGGGGHVTHGPGGNLAASGFSSIVGGLSNTIDTIALYGTIGGGYSNFVGDTSSTISGGYNNSANGASGFIGGGNANTIEDATTASSLVGGDLNTIDGDYSVIVGGHQNSNNTNYSSIVGGDSNTIISNAARSFIGGGQANSISNGNWTGIGSGQKNIIIGSTPGNANYSFIAGGSNNYVRNQHVFIGAGYKDSAEGLYGTIVAGHNNNMYAQSGGIVAGFENTIDTTAISGFIGAGNENSIADSAFYSVIGGGTFNDIEEKARNGVIGGGANNSIIAPPSTSGGLTYSMATIPGGDGLTAQSWAQTVIGAWNIPSGDVPFRYNGVSTDRDDPIFIIGNGRSVGLRGNAFEVSYNGHSIVYDQNNSGASNSAIRGGTYTDNVVYAWADAVPMAGAPSRVDVNCDFGIASISYLSTGQYRVYLNLVDPEGSSINLECISATATLTATNPSEFACAIINTTPVYAGGYFDVYIKTVNCQWADYPFTFKVTGRPE